MLCVFSPGSTNIHEGKHAIPVLLLSLQRRLNLRKSPLWISPTESWHQPTTGASPLLLARHKLILAVSLLPKTRLSPIFVGYHRINARGLRTLRTYQIGGDRCFNLSLNEQANCPYR